MSNSSLVSRLRAASAAGFVVALTSLPAQAFDFSFGDIEADMTVLMSAGATWRMEERDSRLVAKRNLDPTLCSQASLLGTGCLGDESEAAFFNASGSFAPNTDNGNLAYDKGDMVYSAFKITADLSMKWNMFGLFARGIGSYDPRNAGYEIYHPANFDDPQFVSTLQPAFTQRTKDQEDDLGYDLNIEDYYIFADFEVFDRFLSLKLGSQIISWGEQLVLVPNSVNSINVPNLLRLRTPGLDLKELFDPTEIFYASYELSATTSVEAFYQLNWRPIEIDPAESYYSTADVAGAGGSYAMLSFGRAQEDPDNLADSIAYNGANGGGYDQARLRELSGRGCISEESVLRDQQRGLDRQGNADRGSSYAADTAPGGTVQAYNGTSGSTAAAGSGETGGRTLCRTNDRHAKDDGQYGFSLRYYSEALNDTEFGFYYMNYHSRLPIASFYAADANSGYNGFNEGFTDRTITSGVGAIVAFLARTTIPAQVGAPTAQFDGNLEDDVETLFGAFNVADTPTVFLDYPEDLKLYGMSFNTTLGDLSVSGEYSYHRNRPLQINTTDLTYFAQAPAFASLRRGNPNAGLLVGAPGAEAGMVPSFLELYRGGSDESRPDTSLNAARCDGPGMFRDEADRIGQPTNLCPGEYIEGYERFPVGQADLVILSAVSQNPFGADQWIKILEVGFTKVMGMPDYQVDQYGQPVSGLVLQGPGVDTHPTLGRLEVRTGGDNGQGGQFASPVLVPATGLPAPIPPTEEAVNTSALIQNPVRNNDGHPSSFSWGIRQINILSYNNLLFGYNFKPLIAFFWDINGTSPGPGGNHIEGKKTILVGTDFEKGSFGGGIRYTWSNGAGFYNQERDRDNLTFNLRYQF